MKKIVFLLLIILVLYIYSIDEYNVSSDMIRFRIIPNSNSYEDIYIKEKVIDRISNIVFIDSDDPNIVRKSIYSNIENISNEIDNVFKEENYNYSYNIIYGMNDFPKKEYNGIIYPEGKYESLVIEIGDAKGDNFWCMLYPSLCMIDYNNENNKYNSRVFDIFEKFF